jgi:hypothetical protein
MPVLPRACCAGLCEQQHELKRIEMRNKLKKKTPKKEKKQEPKKVLCEGCKFLGRVFEDQVIEPGERKYHWKYKDSKPGYLCHECFSILHEVGDMDLRWLEVA